MRLSSPSRNSARRQRGLSLLFSLLSMVAMTLGTLALVRSVDTGAMLLGNVGFKQDATASAEQATRVAVGWLSENLATLAADAPYGGYYASTQEFAADGITPTLPVDVTGEMITPASAGSRQLVDWDWKSCATAPSGSYGACSITPVVANMVNGNMARYVIFRMCSKPGDFLTDPTVSCAQRAVDSEACGGHSAGERALACAKAVAYYRIVVRVKGERDTTSFTETIVHF